MSFKRRIPSNHANSPPGTRISPSSPSTVLISTGIPSLDDVLGGGLPLSCSSVVLVPDNHSAYGDLVQKYFVSQGIACGQQSFARGCMWTSVRIKIAWRYEKMKMFQTTVASGSSYCILLSTPSDDYCHSFDLSSHIPESVIQDASDTNRLIILGASITRLLGNIQDVLSVSSSETALMRLCIPALGSAQWGDIEARGTVQDVLYFLHSLRRLLRRYPRACASISLAPHICSEAWGGHTRLLRGLSSSAGANAGSGENNLAFKCTRKRLILETIHLDVEGGVTERRTTPSTNNAISLNAGPGRSHAALEVEFERAVAVTADPQGSQALASSRSAALDATTTPKVKRPRKKVAFQSDRPDLYDF
ncbi:PAXNEB-domain-containing protein [Pisolithus microcarpus]|nr:PAXNEB-domain-containing protein [Pisolithus microcarpus]